MGVLTSGQTQFRDRLASQTGLNAGVITAWMLAEESGGAARSRQSSGQHNWLNIGWTDSGRMGLTRQNEWSNPRSAADATALFLKGKKYGASGGIRKIISYANKSVDEQIRAIAGSGWASSGYEGGSTLKSLYNSYGKGVAQPSGMPAVPKAPTVSNAVQSYKPTTFKSSFPQGAFNSPFSQGTMASVLPAIKVAQTPAAAQNPLAQPVQRVANGSVRYESGVQALSHPSIVNILNKISGVYGQPITVGTTTNHSKFTTSGNVSDHYSGNAADIPASGKALTRLGQSALIALGMNPSEARRQTGGLFNLNVGGKRYQVIFNSTTGGNHYNHLHVGVR